jgi:tetratricopeptide (TPR) repeat protein
VAKAKSPSIVTIHLASATRWLLLLPAVCAIFGSWFVVRWYVGNTVAEYAPSVEAGGIDMARMATRWAPGDPFVHWRLASLDEKVFNATNLADAVREYQLAVILSPNDYRYWMELGRSLEATGDIANGEKALQRAVELAPAYSHPRWQYGNLLVREGKLDEAFVQLSRAAEADDLMRPPVFSLAWQVFNGDVDKIATAACSTAAVRIDFATYLIRQEKVDDAVRIWRSVNPADRKAHLDLNEGFKKTLMQSKHFRAVFEVMKETDPDPNGPVPEQFWNGGFERDIEPSSEKSFYWVISSRPQVRVGTDTTAHSGHGSLRIVFKSSNKLDSIGVAQAIVVTPGTQYHFECFVRTQELTSGATPLISIVDATTNAVLIDSPPAASGTNGWQRITLDFKTNPKSDGIIVKLSRGSCGEDQVCPIFGTIWYDDFSLQRSGGSGAARGSAISGKR